MKKAIWIILMVVLAFPMGMVSAQEPGTKEDNACNAGGSMAGKCDTDWEWVCGYYLARWQGNGGWLTPNNPFNDACISLLPPRPLIDNTAVSPSVSCIEVRPNQYANFGGTYFLTAPSDIYSDAACNKLAGVGGWFYNRVYAPSPFNPNLLCLSAFGTSLWGSFDLHPDVYVCN